MIINNSVITDRRNGITKTYKTRMGYHKRGKKREDELFLTDVELNMRTPDSNDEIEDMKEIGLDILVDFLRGLGGGSGSLGMLFGS